MTRSRSPSPSADSGSRGDVPQPVQAGGVADYRTNKAPEVRYEPVKAGGTADYRSIAERASFTKGGGNRSSTSSKAKIVPSNRNHLNTKNNSSSSNNRRGSSSSNTSSFSCKAKFGAVGNCIVGTLAFFFILILIFLAVVFSDGSSADDDTAKKTSSTPKWNGVFNGTYLAQIRSGRFSSKSASTSRSSLAFRFALAEHRLRIDRKTDRATGRTYYEFKSRPAETSSTEYLRQLTFFSGEPFSMSETHSGWSMTTVATITVRKNIWREKYPGMPDLEVEREFLPGGSISVQYSAEDVIYYKKFERIHSK